jgi:hypothetical protein
MEESKHKLVFVLFSFFLSFLSIHFSPQLNLRGHIQCPALHPAPSPAHGTQPCAQYPVAPSPLMASTPRQRPVPSTQYPAPSTQHAAPPTHSPQPARGSTHRPSLQRIRFHGSAPSSGPHLPTTAGAMGLAETVAPAGMRPLPRKELGSQASAFPETSPEGNEKIRPHCPRASARIPLVKSRFIRAHAFGSDKVQALPNASSA